jgi:DNA adenine methylase
MSLRDRPFEFIEAISKIKKSSHNGKDLYRELVRDKTPRDFFQRGIRFFVLNRITYSGTIDSGGYSNEAFHKRFTKSNIAKLEPLSKLLANVEIVNEGYEKLMLESGEGVFIYLDPPYWNSKKSGLYGTNGNLHRFFDHEQLAKNIGRCKHKWLMTCDDSLIMHGLFGMHYTITCEWSYGMTNVNGKKTSLGKELFIANYPLSAEKSEPVKSIPSICS